MDISRVWRNRTIKFRILLMFFIVNLIMICSFGATFFYQNIISSEYNRMMFNNIILGKVSLKVEQTSRLFERSLSSENKDDLKEFYKINRQMVRSLAEIKDDLQQDENTAIHYRYLTYMLDEQLAIAKKILDQPKLNKAVFNDLKVLRTLYQYMERQSQQLIVAYLDYSGSHYAKLQERLRNYQHKILFVVILVSLAGIVFVLIFTGKIFSVISELCKTAKHLADGHWDIPDLRQHKYQDLNYMVTAFNNMKNNINSYILELNQKAELENQLNKEKLASAENEKLLKESRLLALQMQMNPHFLFNTLNLISRMAMFQETDKVRKLLTAISKILRYNLQHEGRLVDLESELKVVEAYLYIQRIRFQDRITFVLETNGDVQQVNLPPMIIQPLIENAIIHGLKDKQENGQVIIRITRESHGVSIRVADNGVGMDEKLLKQVLRNENSIKKESKSIGLANVRKRMDLCFENNHLIEVSSKSGKGTIVDVFIPIEYREG